MPSPRVTVVLGAFEDLIGRGLRAFLEEDANLEVIAAEVPYSRVENVIAARSPRVAVLNYGSLGSSVELHGIATRHPDTRLVVLASRPTPRECNQMLAFGATACLAKDVQARDILTAIHLAARGMHVLPRRAEETVREPLGPELLTPREADVLELLQRGQTNAQIALALHVGVETVRTHARNVYRKLGVSSRRELAALGSRG